MITPIKHGGLSVPSVKIGVITLSFRRKQVTCKKLHGLTLIVIILVIG